MANLPKRSSFITVEIDGADGDERLRVATLTDDQITELLDGSGVRVEGEQVQTTLSTTRLLELFKKQLRGAEDIQVDGEEFDPGDPEHVEALPLRWKLQAASELMQDAMMDEGTGKGSVAPDARSTGATTPPQPSAPASPAS